MQTPPAKTPVSFAVTIEEIDRLNKVLCDYGKGHGLEPHMLLAHVQGWIEVVSKGTGTIHTGTKYLKEMPQQGTRPS